MRKKLVSMCLSAALAVSSLAVCAVNVSAEEAEQTIVFWSGIVESDANRPSFDKAIADFEESHPGVKIKHETYENESYKTKIKAAAAANELPDLFWGWPGGYSKDFADAGLIMDLTPYYENYKEELPESMLSTSTFDGKLYAVPPLAGLSGLYYNKKMFEENGVTVPSNWEEFKAACAAFAEKGITSIALSAKEPWVIAMVHDAIAVETAGVEKSNKALMKDGQSYNDPAFVEAANKLQELIDIGAFSESAVGVSCLEAEEDFYAGKAAMHVMGSWFTGGLIAGVENPDDFGFIPVPALDDANEIGKEFIGGATNVILASANTENPDLTAEAAFELAKSVSQYSYLNGAALPAWKVDYDDSAIDPITKEVSEYLANAENCTIFFNTLMAADDAAEYEALLQEFYVGNLTAEEFVELLAEQLEK